MESIIPTSSWKLGTVHWGLTLFVKLKASEKISKTTFVCRYHHVAYDICKLLVKKVMAAYQLYESFLSEWFSNIRASLTFDKDGKISLTTYNY